MLCNLWHDPHLSEPYLLKPGLLTPPGLSGAQRLADSRCSSHAGRYAPDERFLPGLRGPQSQGRLLFFISMPLPPGSVSARSVSGKHLPDEWMGGWEDGVIQEGFSEESLTGRTKVSIRTGLAPECLLLFAGVPVPWNLRFG